MKKILSLTLAIIMLVSMMVSCESEPDPVDTSDGTDTSASEPETTEDPEETEPETTAAPEETEPPLPVQTDVPCNFDETLDLSEDILVSEFMLEDGKGQWILGDDSTGMTNYITEDQLNEYKYLAIKYTTDYCDENSVIALMFKYVHADETKTEVLCQDWFQWGPADMTYMASSFATMNVYGEGVFYVPTEAFLTHEGFVSGDIINQIGLCAVEESGTYVYLYITGAYLTK